MAKKRKHGGGGGSGGGGHAAKRAKRDQLQPAEGGVTHVVLAQFYSEATTLREYVLSKLPASSRIRRKKIASVGQVPSPPSGTTDDGRSEREDAAVLGQLLDTALVATRPSGPEPEGAADTQPDIRWQQWVGFSQRGDESDVTLSDGLRGSIYSQSEVRPGSGFLAVPVLPLTDGPHRLTKRLSTLSSGCCSRARSRAAGRDTYYAMASGDMLAAAPRRARRRKASRASSPSSRTSASRRSSKRPGRSCSCFWARPASVS